MSGFDKSSLGRGIMRVGKCSSGKVLLLFDNQTEFGRAWCDNEM